MDVITGIIIGLVVGAVSLVLAGMQAGLTAIQNYGKKKGEALEKAVDEWTED